MGGDNVKTNYYRNESWIDSTFSKRGKWVLSLLAVVFAVGVIAGGCSFIPNMGGNNAEEPAPAPVADVNPAPTNEVKVPAENTVDMDVDTEQTSKMVEVSSTSVGRSDPFMPSGEIQAFENAKRSAIAEANAHNARIAQIKKMKNVVIREPDDISPYSFNLPVPPTSLAPENAQLQRLQEPKLLVLCITKQVHQQLSMLIIKIILCVKVIKLWDKNIRLCKSIHHGLRLDLVLTYIQQV